MSLDASGCALPSALRAFALIAAFAAAPSVHAQDIDIVEITIGDIQNAYDDGTYTAEQLTQAFLDRIALYEDHYNAFTTMNLNALDDARAIDTRRAAGEELGPLAGIPIAIKEAVDVAGLPSTAGWAPMSAEAGGLEFIPDTDAPVVRKLREAGAIILGKTNIPAFSLAFNANTSWAGPTYNAIDPALSPGGSSSGSATSVAGSLTVLAVAEETAGSIQAPAAAQGIIGVKTTFGLVPNAGVAPIGGSTRDVLGPYARTVTDAALMLDAMAGWTYDDPKSVSSFGHIPEDGYTSLFSEDALDGVRIGLYGAGWRPDELSEETMSLYMSALEEMKSIGAVTVDDPFAGSGFAELGDGTALAGFDSIVYDFGAYLQRMGDGAPVHSVAEWRELSSADPFGEGSPAMFAMGERKVEDAAALAPDFSAFAELKETYLDTFNSVMDDKKIDVLVFPQDIVGEVPFDGDRSHQPTTTSAINIAGLPGVIIPAGQYASGAPFALILVGRQWSEAQLLAYAYAYEQAFKHRIVPEMAVK